MESGDHCASLLTHFVHPGIVGDGEHLCLVMELFASSIQDMRKALQDGLLPIASVKRVLRHLLLGIVRLHRCGVAHTGMLPSSLDYDDYLCCVNSLADIKPDNIMIDLGLR